MAQKSRAWCFTWNNYPSDAKEILQKINYRYIIVGEETAPSSGTQHLQGYVYFVNATHFNSMKKMLPHCHIEKARGNFEQNHTYCTKDKIFLEDGEPPKQGRRVDLEELRDNLRGGSTTVREILMDNPVAYHQYGRTLNAIEDEILRTKFRTEMTKGIWYFGATGVGKSHKAFEGYSPATHYLWQLHDKGWQDGYIGQETVIINDFRGEISYNELLQMVDKWPHTVSRRGRPPAPFLAKTVIITSSLPPESIYNRRATEDSIEQLRRRFEIIKVESGTEVVGVILNPTTVLKDNIADINIDDV